MRFPTGVPDLSRAEKRVVRRAFLVGLFLGAVIDVGLVFLGLV